MSYCTACTFHKYHILLAIYPHHELENCVSDLICFQENIIMMNVFHVLVSSCFTSIICGQGNIKIQNRKTGFQI